MVDIKSITRYASVLCCVLMAACTSLPVQEEEKPVPVEERTVEVQENEIKIKVPVEEKISTLPDGDMEKSTEKEFDKPLTEPTSELGRTGGPAIIALLEDAERYENSGRSDQASATIERALRIEPKNPLLWQRLGYLHLQNHRWQQAIAMAQKSNTLAGGNRQLMVTNWKIIARAKNKIGDEQGAKEAEKIIQTLEN